ncbi:hypothetical protein D3C76_1055840 [compost metagenome]
MFTPLFETLSAILRHQNAVPQITQLPRQQQPIGGVIVDHQNRQRAGLYRRFAVHRFNVGQRLQGEQFKADVDPRAAPQSAIEL